MNKKINALIISMKFYFCQDFSIIYGLKDKNKNKKKKTPLNLSFSIKYLFLFYIIERRESFFSYSNQDN